MASSFDGKLTVDVSMLDLALYEGRLIKSTRIVAAQAAVWSFLLVMPSAEIITIGTEILLGEIVDTNTRYIARTLRNMGVTYTAQYHRRQR
jgi:molybdopterin biosynthesis enzyme